MRTIGAIGAIGGNIVNYLIPALALVCETCAR